MSGTAPEQEPSIEEILASIRQIISDDDEGAPAASAAPEPVQAPPPPPPPAPKPKEDVLELRDPLPVEKPIIDMVEDDEPMAPEPRDLGDSSIFTDHAKEAAMSGFARLASNIAVDRHRQTGAGVTLEDVVRDMLQPMLRTWLDDNLPGIIDKLVQKELDKVARQAMDD